MGVAACGAFYALTDAGSVVVTRDLRSWNTVITSDYTLITIECWAERD